MRSRSTTGDGQTADQSQRRFALVAAIGLLFMAVLAPFAQFGVLQTLIVPADAAATTANILASAGIFRAAIAAFLIIAILDIVVAWGLYILLRPTNASLALLVAWLRVAYAAVFAYALVNLLDVAQLLQGSDAAGLSPDRSRPRSLRRSPHSTTAGTWRSRSSAFISLASVPCCSGPSTSRRSSGHSSPSPASATWPTRSGRSSSPATR